MSLTQERGGGMGKIAILPESINVVVQGGRRLVPRQLQHRDPHRQHLAHPLPRRLEVHHDKVHSNFYIGGFHR